MTIMSLWKKRLSWNNNRILLAEKKYVGYMVLSLVLLILLLLYGEYRNPEEGKYLHEGRKLVYSKDDPLEFIASERRQVINGREPVITDSFYNEINLYERLALNYYSQDKYREKINQYIQEQKFLRQNIVSDKASFHQAEYMEKQYQRLLDVRLQNGNYLSAEKYFKFGICELIILVVLIITIRYLVINERENGIGELIKATARGEKKYYTDKLLSFVSVGIIYVVIFQGIKFSVYSVLYGIPDFGAAIQNLETYRSSVLLVNIGQMIMLHLLLCIMVYVLIMMILFVIAILPVSETVYILILSGLIVFEIILNNLKADSFVFRIISDSSLLRLFDRQLWLEREYYLYLGESGKKVFYLSGRVLPLFVLIKIPVFYLAGRQLFKSGYCSSTSKNRTRRVFPGFGNGVFVNELEMVIFFRKRLFMIVAFLAVGIYFMNPKEYKNDDLRIEREYVSLLNSKDYDDARSFLEEKISELEQLEIRINELDIEYAMGEIDENAYSLSKATINNQLRLKDIVEGLYAQTADIEKLGKDKNIEAGFEYKSFSDELFGNGGKADQAVVMMILAFCIVCGGMSLFPSERNRQLNILFGASKDCKKMIMARIIIFSLLVFVLAVILNVIRIHGAEIKYGVTNGTYDISVLKAQTMSKYRKYAMDLYIRTALGISVVWNAFLWGLVAFLCLSLSLFFSNIVIAIITGFAVLTVPIYLKLLKLGKCDLSDSVGKNIFIAALIAAAGTFILSIGKRKWVKYND